MPVASDGEQERDSAPFPLQGSGHAHERLLPPGPPHPEPQWSSPAAAAPPGRALPALTRHANRLQHRPAEAKAAAKGRSGEHSRKVARGQPGQDQQRQAEEGVRRRGCKVHWRFHLASALRTRHGDVAAPPLLGDAHAF